MSTEDKQKDVPVVPQAEPVLAEAVPIISAQPMSAEPRTRQQADGLQTGLILRIPKSTPDRLIIPLETEGWFSRGPGFSRSLRAAAPPPLQERGVTDGDWRAWLERFEAEAQSRQCACGWCGVVCGLISVVGLPCAYCAMARYQRAVGAWLGAANAELFEPRGMFAATQTVSLDLPIDTDGNADNGTSGFHDEASWLAIALNPAEAAALSAEPHLWTVGDSCWPWAASAGAHGAAFLYAGGLDNMYPEDERCNKTLCCIGAPRVV